MTDAELAASIDSTSREWDEVDRQLSLVRRPEYIVSGEVRDRDETSVVVWGVAVPTNPQNQNDLGAHMTKANLIVSPYDAQGLMGGQFYHGTHCFVRRTTGKNGFGATVPMWCYGEQPAEAIALIQKLRDVDALNNAARAERARRQAEAKQAQAVHDAQAQSAAGSSRSVSSPMPAVARDVTLAPSPTASVPQPQRERAAPSGHASGTLKLRLHVPTEAEARKPIAKYLTGATVRAVDVDERKGAVVVRFVVPLKALDAWRDRA